MPRKMILDTDPGVDDAVAIFLTLASPEIDLLGLTTIYGNATIDRTTRNALALLEIAERQDIPVVQGAAAPLQRPFAGAVPHVHGENGLGNAEFNLPVLSPHKGDAADWMYEQVASSPGEVTVLTVGPVTNLAIALRRYPDFQELVGDVVVMGGNAIIPGNITPAAEANIFNDPEAADMVFGASCRLAMVGLDVTHSVNLTRKHIARLTRVEKEVNQFLAQALPYYQAFFEATNGIDGMYLHDPTAVMYVVAPELFTAEQAPVRVETENYSRGKTWPSFEQHGDAAPEPWQNRPLVDVCVAVDHEAIIGALLDRLS